MYGSVKEEVATPVGQGRAPRYELHVCRRSCTLRHWCNRVCPCNTEPGGSQHADALTGGEATSLAGK
jgi:hypothetical protein